MAGISYAATFMEARLCVALERIVVDGGNSAEQAAVLLAYTAKHVRARSMRRTGRDLSSCLIRRITEHPAIRPRTRTEPTRRDGAQRCERVRWRDRRSVRSETHASRHIFVIVGVTPGTGWLAGRPERSPSAARRE